MPSEDLIVDTLDGSPMSALLVWPDGAGPWPVAVVLGELFGLTDVQRGAAEHVAALGYVAVAPDLLHRRAPGGPLQEDDDGRARGLALIAELTRLELLSDVRDALAAARSRPHADVDAASVAVGMSFGGHVAVLAAARLGLGACVGMYVGWLAGTTIAASQPRPTGSLPLTGPLLLLAGEEDPMVPLTDIDAVRTWHPDAEVVTYPGVGHRFCSVGRPGYDEAAATDAWGRIGAFLAAARPEGTQTGWHPPQADVVGVGGVPSPGT
jgi:carboxymethylenebutenolidase